MINPLKYQKSSRSNAVCTSSLVYLEIMLIMYSFSSALSLILFNSPRVRYITLVVVDLLRFLRRI